MADIVTIAASFTGLAKTVAEIASSSDAAKRNTLLIEFQQALIQAQGITASEQVSNASLRTRNQELEAEIVRLKDWSAEKSQYESVPFSYGMFARIHKSNVSPLAEAHKFCHACFDNGKKTLLQMQTGEERRRGLFCPACKITLWLYHNAFSDELRG